MYTLILASQSPRRRLILEQHGFNVVVDTVKISEIIKENLSWDGVLRDLARQKSEAYINSRNPLELKGKIILTADTLVVFNNKALGKPKNRQEAIEFLRSMSGNSHQVLTGVCLYNGTEDQLESLVEITNIQFKELSQNEIEAYVDTGEPMDKAGAYGIQGEGGKFVESYEGSYYNVVGLPIEAVEKLLKEKNWDVARTKS
ncbi:MAG: septum formation protein Maf [Bdellovibrionaceae bacterium]|nr:septum formation protein Maf [Pseudobdellovibrionaceae bacterium]|tara:strand:- start:248 stop:850 length:603 start_codon:yes stop_codon:yes gene_type:complete